MRFGRKPRPGRGKKNTDVFVGERSGGKQQFAKWTESGVWLSETRRKKGEGPVPCRARPCNSQKTLLFGGEYQKRKVQSIALKTKGHTRDD